MDTNQAGQNSVYLKATSVLTINALENGDFLNFIFYFLATKHELIHTHQKHPSIFLHPTKAATRCDESK